MKTITKVVLGAVGITAAYLIISKAMKGSKSSSSKAKENEAPQSNTGRPSGGAVINADGIPYDVQREYNDFVDAGEVVPVRSGFGSHANASGCSTCQGSFGSHLNAVGTNRVPVRRSTYYGSSSKLKNGDSWFDPRTKECCIVVDNIIKCKSAPCSLPKAEA